MLYFDTCVCVYVYYINHTTMLSILHSLFTPAYELHTDKTRATYAVAENCPPTCTRTMVPTVRLISFPFRPRLRPWPRTMMTLRASRRPPGRTRHRKRRGGRGNEAWFLYSCQGKKKAAKKQTRRAYHQIGVQSCLYNSAWAGKWVDQ